MPSRRLSGIFQIERELLGRATSGRRAVGRHHDSGAAIELCYDNNSYGGQKTRRAYSNARNFNDPLQYERDLSNYVVESFEEEQPAVARPPERKPPYEPAVKKQCSGHSHDRLPGNQTNILTKEPEISDEDQRPSLQPKADTEQKSEAATFEEDLHAILSQQKASSPEKNAEPMEELSHKSDTPSHHAIFDQIGKNLSQANSFDLGAIAMDRQFDEFDQALDRQSKPQPRKPKTTSAPAEKIESFSGPVELSALDIAEDFAIMTENDESPNTPRGSKATLKSDSPVEQGKENDDNGKERALDDEKPTGGKLASKRDEL